MPNVTTYIRKDDMELWLACPNKAELIHNALHPVQLPEGNPYSRLTVSEHKKYSKAAEELLPKRQYIREDIINAPEEVVEIAKTLNLSPDRGSNGICKVHHTPLDNRGKCLQKGCRYA